MCALACTITHVATQQLFVYYDDGALDKPFSKQRLKCWLCEGISHACELTDLDPWSHLSALYPFLEVLFRKASGEDPCLKSVLVLLLMCCCSFEWIIYWLIDPDHLLVLEDIYSCLAYHWLLYRNQVAVCHLCLFNFSILTPLCAIIILLFSPIAVFIFCLLLF